MSNRITMRIVVATVPQVAMDGAMVRPFPSRLELMAARSETLSPRLSQVLDVLLDASRTTSAAGGDDLQSLWAQEAIHRAYNMVQLMPRLRSSATAGISAGATMQLNHVTATDLASLFRALDFTPDDAEVPCSTILRGVVCNLVALFGSAAGQVAITTDIEPLCLPTRKRRALVLAASELVVNSLRHGFVGRCRGRIEVILHAVDATRARLAVVDDGIGLLGHRPSPHCGVAASLVAQLEANLVYRRRNRGGTVAEFVFPTDRNASRRGARPVLGECTAQH